MKQLIRHILREHTREIGEGGTGKKQTKEGFIDKANKVHGNKYDYSKVDYVNSGTKVEIICPEHGSFFQSPRNHIAGQGCKQCGLESNRQKFTKNSDKFKEQANLIHNNKYDYSKVNYVNNHTPVEIICPEHGSFFQSPGSHLSGRRCPVCGRTSGVEKHIKWTKENVLSAASKYETISDFQNNEPSAYMAARKNGWMDEIIPLMKVMKQTWTKDSIIDLMKNYTNKSDFTDDHPNARMAAMRHGWWDEITSHMDTVESRGEILVNGILTKNSINFNTQQKFKDCTSKRGKYCRKLPFDFYVPDYNVCIEYDGRQHFEPVYGEEQLEIQKFIDNLKDEYCKKNGIKLIRIPYTMKKEEIEPYILKELGIK